jgi:hypothetical protein
MPPYYGEIPYKKRVAVVALRLLADLKFAEIGKKVNLKLYAIN